MEHRATPTSLLSPGTRKSPQWPGEGHCGQPSLVVGMPAGPGAGGAHGHWYLCQELRLGMGSSHGELPASWGLLMARAAHGLQAWGRLVGGQGPC